MTNNWKSKKNMYTVFCFLHKVSHIMLCMHINLQIHTEMFPKDNTVYGSSTSI